MRFKIERTIFEKFPGLHIGVIIATGVNNSGVADEVLQELGKEETRIRANYNAETLSQQPKIEVWRKAYAAFKGEPKRNRSSVETLYRCILDNRGMRHINLLVDIYNLVSLRRMLPIGGEDLDKVRGDILLTFAGPNEAPLSIHGENEARPPHEGEVIYKDDVSAICRRFNWREAERTELTEGTKRCVLMVEGLPPVTKAEVEAAMLELMGLVRKFCGADVTGAVLDEIRPEILI